MAVVVGVAVRAAMGANLAAAAPDFAPRGASGIPSTIEAESAETFAVIGDFGSGSNDAKAVADLVRSWGPDWIVTVGDNNYPEGRADTIDPNIGQYYHDYIGSYDGAYGNGAAENRFYPALGNHDWITKEAAPYLAYFELPGNERYYEVARGPVRFFFLNSNPGEPDGADVRSKQAKWLHASLARAVEPWKIVVCHHAPYSSGSEHGCSNWMQWPFAKWGASAVLSGHDHDYERFVKAGIPYFVNGLGGAQRRTLGKRISGSKCFYDRDYGALKLSATQDQLEFAFVDRKGAVIDRYVMSAGTRAAR